MFYQRHKQEFCAVYAMPLEQITFLQHKNADISG